MKTGPRPFLLSLVLFSLLCEAAVCLPAGHMQQGPATGTVRTNGGLQVVTFDAPQGRIIVNLPDDMRAGDTISGTVFAELKGSFAKLKENTDEEQFRDVALGYVVSFAWARAGAQTAPVTVPLTSGGYKKGEDISPAELKRIWDSLAGGRNFKITLPASSENMRNELLEISLKDITTRTTTTADVPDPNKSQPGRVIATTTVPIVPTIEMHTITPLRSWELPTFGQEGRPIEIIGPFDGNIGNTRLMYGPAGSSLQDFEKNTENVSGGFGLIRPIAESPRKCVFTAPTNVTGPIELHLKEGNKEAMGSYRNVGVNLSAPKTNLLKGEGTTLTGMFNVGRAPKQPEQPEKPVPVVLTAEGVITMEGGNFQQFMILPSQVGADGTFTITRRITGVQTGAWSATATIVTQPFNIVLRDPDPPQTILVNSFTGDYVFCGSGPKLTGTGQIKRQGCVLTLTDNRPDRRINGTFDGCTPVDNGRFWVFYSAGTSTDVKVTVTDTEPKRTRVYFNPLGKPAPPVQDVSAFATCP